MQNKNLAKNTRLDSFSSPTVTFEKSYSGDLTIAVKPNTGTAQVNYRLFYADGTASGDTDIVNYNNTNNKWYYKNIEVQDIIGIGIYCTGNSELARTAEKVFIAKGKYTITSDDDYVEYEEQTITFPLAEGQVLHKDDYLADDGIHHKRKHAVVSISGIVTLSNGNVGGVCHLSNKIDKGDNMIISSNAVFKNSYNPPAGTVYENRLNIVFVGNQEDTLETLKEKYGGSIVEYELQDEEIEAYTEEQKQIYNKIQELHSYYGTTHITCEDEISCNFDIIYVQDHKLVRQNDKQELQTQIDEIKTLLSTTSTSAMLLDNLQTDLESEV